MGILDFLPKRKFKKSPEKIWQEYTVNYFKKYRLVGEMRDIIEYNSNDLDLHEQIINKVIKIEKLIPNELIKLDNEEIDLEKVVQELESIRLLNPKLNDIKYIIENYDTLLDDANKVVLYMKEALEMLAKILKAQISLINLIKKHNITRKIVLDLFQLVVNQESRLVEIFGAELYAEEYKKVKRIIHAALKDTKIKKLKNNNQEDWFENYDLPNPRKNRLDKIVEIYANILNKLGEGDNFEIFCMQSHEMEIRYGIFIRLKSNKLKYYLINYFLAKDLDKKISNDKFFNDKSPSQQFGKYTLEGDETEIKRGIRILKSISK